MFTKTYFTDTGIRVVRTFAQALIADLGLDSVGVVHAHWTQALAVAGGAALMAALTALAGTSAPNTVSLTEDPTQAPQKTA